MTIDYVIIPKGTNCVNSLDEFKERLDQLLAILTRNKLPALLIRNLLMYLMHTIDVRIANTFLTLSYVNIDHTFDVPVNLTDIVQAVFECVKDERKFERTQAKQQFPITIEIIRFLSIPDKRKCLEVSMPLLSDEQKLELISKYRFSEEDHPVDLVPVKEKLIKQIGKQPKQIPFARTIRHFVTEDFQTKICILPSSMILQVVSNLVFSL